MPHPPAPDSCSHSFCHIFRGLFFISAAICSSGGAAKRLALKGGPAPPPPSGCPTDTNHPSTAGQDLPPPRAPPQCHRPLRSAGREQGSASHPGGGLGARVAQGGGLWGGHSVFCFSEMHPMSAVLLQGLDRGIVFYVAGEWPAKREGVRLITLFLFKLFKSQH